MPFTFDDIPNLNGQVAIITGGNAGIGEVCTRELVKKNCKVFVFTRSKTRFDQCMQRMQSKSQVTANVHFIPCDLSDLNSVKSAVDEFKRKESSLNILINNAGIMAVPYSLTKQGLEIQIGTNLVGHALLSFLLLDVIVSTSRKSSSKSVRMIHLSSEAHERFGGSGPEYSWDSLDKVNQDMRSTWKRYGKSKIGNVLLSNEMKKLTAKENVVNIAVNPGNVNTGLYAGLEQSYGFMGKVAAKAMSLAFVSPEKGALSSLYAATSADVDTKNLNGAFLAPMAKVGKAASWAEDKDGSSGASMMRFIKSFTGEKMSIDLDAIEKQAL